MVVTYERASTEGLTADDMVEVNFCEIWPATSIALEIDAAANEQYGVRGKPVASWEDSQYSLNLVRSSFSSTFQLIIYSKTSHGRSRCSVAEVVKVDELAAPQKQSTVRRRNWMRSNLLDKRTRKAFAHSSHLCCNEGSLGAIKEYDYPEAEND